jgi:hypothetical protein
VPLDPKTAALAGRIGAYRAHASHDVRQLTERARTAAFDAFLREVDPSQELPVAERLRRATAARNAHMAQLALKSSRARRLRASSSRGSDRATAMDTSAGAVS